MRKGIFLEYEFEIRIGVGEGILHEVLLEVGIPLLIVGHRRITKVVEIHVFDAVSHRIRKPTVDKTGSSLNGFSIGTGKCHEMRA